MREMNEKLRAGLGEGMGREKDDGVLRYLERDKRFYEGRHTNTGGDKSVPTPEESTYYQDLCLLLGMTPVGIEENLWKKQVENGKKRSKAVERLKKAGFDAELYRREENVGSFANKPTLEKLIRGEQLDEEETDKLAKDNIQIDILQNVARYRNEAETSAATHSVEMEPAEAVETEKKDQVFYDDEKGDSLMRDIEDILLDPRELENRELIKLATASIRRHGISVPEMNVYVNKKRASEDERKRATVLVEERDTFLADLRMLRSVKLRGRRPGDAAAADKRLRERGFDTSTILEKLGIPSEIAPDEEESPKEDEKTRRLRQSFEATGTMFRGVPTRLVYLRQMLNEFQRRNSEVVVPVELRNKMVELEGLIKNGSDNIGATEVDTSKGDLLHSLLSMPLPGGKYFATFENEMGGQSLQFERVALLESRYLNVDVLKDYFFNQWRESMSGLFGESGVDDPRAVASRVLNGATELKGISDRIRQSIIGLQSGKLKLEEAFPSLVGHEGDPLGVSEISKHFKENGFSINDPLFQQIPEIAIKVRIDELLEYQEALAGEIGLLSSLRANGSDIEKMAQAVTPYESKKLALLWSAGEVFRGEDGLTGEKIKPLEDYQDEIMRLHWIIGRISDLKPGEEIPAGDRDKIPPQLENFIREYLTERDVRIEEENLKDEEFVLNRWANASAGYLKKFNNFVSLATRLDIRRTFTSGATPDAEKLKLFDEKFKELNSSEVPLAVRMGAKKPTAEIAVEFAMTRAETDLLSLGFAEQMGGYVVKRGIKQKDRGTWDKSDIEKAIKRGDLYTRSGTKIVSLPPESEYKELVAYERKVAVYPVSTDMTKLTRVATKIEGEIDEGASYGSAGLSVAIQKKLIPQMWIGNMLQTTKVTEAGIAGEEDKVKTLWDIWWNEEQSLKSVSNFLKHDSKDERVASSAPEDAVTKWQKNRNMTFKLWKFLKSEDPKDLEGFFSDDTPESISSAIKYGFLVPDLTTEERNYFVSRLKGVIYGSWFVQNYGYTGQFRGGKLWQTKGEVSTVDSVLNKNRIQMLIDMFASDKYLNQLGKEAFKTILMSFETGKGRSVVYGFDNKLGGVAWRDRWNAVKTF